MSDKLTELCPICIESPIQHYTECNHGYCIGCLCRITRCAMCRNPLQRTKICNEIKYNIRLIEPDINPIIFNNNEEFSRRVRPTSRNGDLTSRMYLSVTLPELNNPNIYTYPRGRLNPTSNLIDSANYMNEEYNPIISYHGQFPNDPIPSHDNDFQMRRGMLTYIHSPNRIPTRISTRIPRWEESRH